MTVTHSLWLMRDKWPSQLFFVIFPVDNQTKLFGIHVAPLYDFINLQTKLSLCSWHKMLTSPHVLYARIVLFFQISKREKSSNKETYRHSIPIIWMVESFWNVTFNKVPIKSRTPPCPVRDNYNKAMTCMANKKLG